MEYFNYTLDATKKDFGISGKIEITRSGNKSPIVKRKKEQSSDSDDNVGPVIVSVGKLQNILKSIRKAEPSFPSEKLLPVSSENSAGSGDETNYKLESLSTHLKKPRIASVNKTTGVQTDDGLYEVLLPELAKLQSDKSMLEAQLLMNKSIISNVPDDRTMMKLTSMNFSNFDAVCELLSLQPNTKQDFFMLLIKMKNGMCNEILSFMFKMSFASICRKLNSVIDIVYDKIKAFELWKPKKNVYESLPTVFKNYFPKCRVIIDSLELKITPNDLSVKKLTFSEKYNCSTIKCLLGFTPSGSICFISDIFGGSTTEAELLSQSGILSLLEEDDAIALDMNLTLEEELKDVQFTLYPAEYVIDRLKFYIIEQDANSSSRKCILVPRAVWNFEKFRFFDEPISSNSLQSIHKLITIVSFIMNFGKI